MENKENAQFDFEAHRDKAISEYRKVRSLYELYSHSVKSIIEKSLSYFQIKFHSIEARAKDLEKFGDKAAKPSSENINEPKYKEPLTEITDLSGVRVITFFPITIDHVDDVINNEFSVLEKSNKSDLLAKEEKLGYQSVHYLVKLKEERTRLPEYTSYRGLICEIQVRTILQHAWAEIEHDIEYKSSVTIPVAIKRRFMSLAGLLEIADREFQSIHNENQELKMQARKSVVEGNLNDIEITADSLRAYLDKKFGPDGRMSEFSYDYTAELLIKMGFRNLKQVDKCISGFDDDKISRLLWGGRQGQLNRFEDVLLASMGINFSRLHPWCIEPNSSNDSWEDAFRSRLAKLEKAGIITGQYSPDADN